MDGITNAIAPCGMGCGNWRCSKVQCNSQDHRRLAGGYDYIKSCSSALTMPAWIYVCRCCRFLMLSEDNQKTNLLFTENRCIILMRVFIKGWDKHLG